MGRMSKNVVRRGPSEVFRRPCLKVSKASKVAFGDTLGPGVEKLKYHHFKYESCVVAFKAKERTDMVQ